MSFFKQLMEKPWETEGNNIVALTSAGEAPSPPAKVALMFLLVSMTFVFALISIGYTYRLTLPDWQSLPDPGLLWINTLVLFLSSLFLERARKVARRGEIEKTKTYINWGLFDHNLLFGTVLGLARTLSTRILCCCQSCKCFLLYDYLAPCPSFIWRFNCLV